MLKNQYQYQNKAAKAVLSMALSNKYQAAILAGAPGCGKTTIAALILNDFFKQFPNAKCVILTHNQVNLQTQMIENFTNSNVPVEFTYGFFGTNAQVQIGIPANADRIKEIDLLIIDEAHNYWGESMVNAIVSKHKPKYQILMTGSPSYFIRYNKAVEMSGKNLKKFGMYFIAASDLMENNVFSPVDLDVVKADSNQIQAVFNHARKEGYDMTKVMWACKTVAEARQTAQELAKMGKKTYLSTSHDDASSSQIDAFKAATSGILIVVGKGILGFSDNLVTAVVDMKLSQDLDTRNQLFARVLRKHPSGIRKTYMAVTTPSKYNNEVIMLQNIVDLMQKSVFTTYSGK